MASADGMLQMDLRARGRLEVDLSGGTGTVLVLEEQVDVSRTEACQPSDVAFVLAVGRLSSVSRIDASRGVGELEAVRLAARFRIRVQIQLLADGMQPD